MIDCLSLSSAGTTGCDVGLFLLCLHFALFALCFAVVSGCSFFFFAAFATHLGLFSELTVRLSAGEEILHFNAGESLRVGDAKFTNPTGAYTALVASLMRCHRDSGEGRYRREMKFPRLNYCSRVKLRAGRSVCTGACRVWGGWLVV